MKKIHPGRFFPFSSSFPRLFSVFLIVFLVLSCWVQWNVRIRRRFRTPSTTRTTVITSMNWTPWYSTRVRAAMPSRDSPGPSASTLTARPSGLDRISDASVSLNFRNQHCQWTILAFSMDNSYVVNGQFLRCQWTILTFSMDNSCVVNGQFLRFQWTILTFSMDNSYVVNGQFLRFQWTILAFSMDNSYVFNGQFLRFQWRKSWNFSILK